MRAELMELAMPRLRRSLGVAEGDEDALTDALAQAAERICRYLNRADVPACAEWLLVELAAARYRHKDAAHGAVKSESCAEGQLSQSFSYLTPEEQEAAEQKLLETLAPYRQVACKGGAL